MHMPKACAFVNVHTDNSALFLIRIGMPKACAFAQRNEIPVLFSRL